MFGVRLSNRNCKTQYHLLACLISKINSNRCLERRFALQDNKFSVEIHNASKLKVKGNFGMDERLSVDRIGCIDVSISHPEFTH